MRSALEARGRAPVWIEQPEEGHGFGLLENNVDLYRKMLDFLDRHIGAGRPKTGGN
jgi:dipeptidyl aminopeptidase/acylaminoacyl peptidase